METTKEMDPKYHWVLIIARLVLAGILVTGVVFLALSDYQNFLPGFAWWGDKAGKLAGVLSLFVALHFLAVLTMLGIGALVLPMQRWVGYGCIAIDLVIMFISLKTSHDASLGTQLAGYQISWQYWGSTIVIAYMTISITKSFMDIPEFKLARIMAYTAFLSKYKELKIRQTVLKSQIAAIAAAGSWKATKEARKQAALALDEHINTEVLGVSHGLLTSTPQAALPTAAGSPAPQQRTPRPANGATQQQP